MFCLIIFKRKCSMQLNAGWWWLEHFLVFHILGLIIPIDWYFSERLKPPTSKVFTLLCSLSTQRHNWLSDSGYAKKMCWMILVHSSLVSKSISNSPRNQCCFMFFQCFRTRMSWVALPYALLLDLLHLEAPLCFNESSQPSQPQKLYKAVDPSGMMIPILCTQPPKHRWTCPTSPWYSHDFSVIFRW